MKAGTLRHYITIESQATTQNAAGEPSGTWSASSYAYAAIWPLRGSEYLNASQERSSVTHRVRIRYLSGLAPENRIKFGSRYFNIVSIINVDERNIYQDIMASEVI